jgi:hypothetical protein
MAKSIVLQLGDETSSFGFSKLDRAKLYGYKEKQVVDAEGLRCSPAYLTADGAALVPGGGLAMLYVDENFATIERSTLLTVNDDGASPPLMASTLDVAQQLEGPVSAQQLLDHIVHTVYELDPTALGAQLAAQLEAGSIYSAPFSYRDDYQLQNLFLLKGEGALFAMIGTPTSFAYVRRDAILEDSQSEEDDLSDDLDFSMM